MAFLLQILDMPRSSSVVNTLPVESCLLFVSWDFRAPLAKMVGRTESSVSIFIELFQYRTPGDL